jgi:hypothetical protein
MWLNFLLIHKADIFWWLSHPSEKYEFVCGDDETPNI